MLDLLRRAAMTNMRRFGLGDLILFLVIVAGAAGARAWYVVYCANDGSGPAPVRVQGEDSEARQRLVSNLKEQQWFATRVPFAGAEETTAHVSPGYPALLALVARWVDDYETAVRWGQVGL